MNKLYVEAISSGNFAQFNQLFDQNRQQLSLINIITILFHFAKFRHRHLQLAIKHGNDTSNMYLDTNKMEYLLEALSSKADTVVGSGAGGEQGITGQSLGNLLYSLYGAGPHSDPACEKQSSLAVQLLDIVCRRYLEPFSGNMKPREVANALYGLQCFSGDERCGGRAGLGPLLLAVADQTTRHAYSLLTPIIDRSILEHTGGAQQADIKEIKAAELGSGSNCRHFSSQDLGLVHYGLKSNVLEPNDGGRALELQALMAVLARKISRGHPCSSPQSIGSALFGLRGLSSELPVVRSIVSALNSRIFAPSLPTPRGDIHKDQTGAADCGMLFNAQHVSNSLYGLQSMTSDHPEVRAMMSTLATVIQNSITFNNLGKTPGRDKKEGMTDKGKAAMKQQCLIGQHVGNSLYGLQNMSAEHSETRALLSALIPLLKTTEAEESILPRNVDNAIFGLKNMSSNHREVRKVLSLLDIKIHSCSQQWGCENIARAMYGLQNMSSGHAEVRDVIASLSVELSTCVEAETVGGDMSMSSQSLGNILAGMQFMSSDHTETKDFISALLSVTTAGSSGSLDNNAVEMLYRQLDGDDNQQERDMEKATNMCMDTSKHAHAAITSQNIGMALYGLQHMTAINSIEIVQLLTFLAHWIETGRTYMGDREPTAPPAPTLQWLDSQAVSTALYGLQQMPSSMPEVSRLLEVLAARIEAAEDAAVSVGPSSPGYHMTQMSIGRCIYGMQNMSSADPAVTRFVAALLPRIGLDPLHVPTMSQRSIASSFYGLRNMTADDGSVRALVGVLTSQLDNWLQRGRPLSPGSLTHVLYGVQSLLRAPGQDLSPDTHAAMTACSGSLLTTVNASVHLLAQQNPQLSMLQTSMCLNGLLEISDEVLLVEPCSATFDLLCHWAEVHTTSIIADFNGTGTGTGTGGKASTTHHIASLYQSILLAVHALTGRGVIDPDVVTRLARCSDQLHTALHVYDNVRRRYVSVLSTEISGRDEEGLGSSSGHELAIEGVAPVDAQVPVQGAPNSFERSWITSTKRLFGRYPEIVVESRTWLHGFEADIVITVPTQERDGGSVVINVELDGPHHHYFPHKQRFTRLRDACLQLPTDPSQAAQVTGVAPPTASSRVFVVRIPFQDRADVNRRVAKKKLDGKVSATGLATSISAEGNTRANVGRIRARTSRITRQSGRDVELENWRQRALWHYLEPVLVQYYNVTPPEDEST